MTKDLIKVPPESHMKHNKKRKLTQFNTTYRVLRQREPLAKDT